LKAIQITEFGGPETLVVRDLPDPQAVDGEAVLDVLAAGVNYADTHQTEDSYLAKQSLPLIPGGEVVARDESGRRLLGLVGNGGYAQRIAVDPRRMFPVPDNVSDGQALTTLVQIIQELEKLFSGNKSASASTPGGTTPSTTTVTSNPVTAPVTPPPVASASGQQVGTTPTTSTVSTPVGTQPNPYSYTPPALGGTGTTPSTADSWIPVDPPATTTPTAPTTTPSVDPGVIKVTTTIGDESTTVEIPTGHDAQLDVDIPVNGQHVTEHISVTGTGKVGVS